MFSSFSLSWRKRLFLSCLLRPSGATRPRSNRSMWPKVELLEDRCLPSVNLNLTVFHDPSRTASGSQTGSLGIPLDGGFTFPIGYLPSDLQAAYGINNIMFGSVRGNGAGQTIAIVDAYDDPAFVDSAASNFSSSDLANFDSQLGIPDPPSFEKVNEEGAASPLPEPDPAGPGNATGNWEIEEALDVEWAHGIAPGANIILVEAKTANNSDLFAAVQTAASLPGVSAVSMSWGVDEYDGETSEDSIFVTPSGHQGVTFLAASGDNGGYSYDAQGNPTTIPGILYPAASPNVVAVGGTTLELDTNDNVISETAWSGSGGGTSLYEKESAFQENVQQTNYRTTPDVAFDADPNTGVAVYDSYNDVDGSGPWVEVGGTSLASPSWAGLIAIANQGRVLNGGATLAGSQTLSALYAFPPVDFNDITSGSNGVFNAGPGYDEVTGLGSPNASNLMASLTTYGTANHIAITSQPPSSVIVGDGFGVVAAAEDPAGNIDPAFNGALTISLDSDPSGATLGGTYSATASDGIAVFDGLSLDELGNGYTLEVSGTQFPSITTNSFNVISNPTPWQGTFYPVPTDASLRTAISEADSNGFAFNTILLSSSTYQLSNLADGAIAIANASSLPSKTLAILGQGASNSLIGSVYSWKDRIFEIEGSTSQALDVVMQDLTIEGGNAQNGGILGGTAALGGALLIDGADVTLSDDVLQDNQAVGAVGAAGKAGAIGAKGSAGGAGGDARGGALYLAGGSLLLINDTIANDTARGGMGGAGGAGGGQGSKSAAAVKAGTGGSGGQGGSASGGAIFAASGTVQIDHGSFNSNKAIGGAGGTGGSGGSGGHGNTKVAGVTGGPGGAGGKGGAATGGAIYLVGGAITLTAAELQKNAARGGAGGQGGAGGPGTAEGGSSLSGIFGGSGSTSFNFGGLGSGAGGPGGKGGHGGTGGSASAGGVYVAGGTLTLVNATLAGNQAIAGAGGQGGQGGTAGFGQGSDSLGFPIGKTGGAGGTGGQAGAAYGGGILVAGGKVVLYADTLSGNLAGGGKGGVGGAGGQGPLALLGGSGSSGLGSGFGSGGGSDGGSGFGSSSGFGGGGGLTGNSAGAGGNGGNGGTGKGGGVYVTGGTFILSNVTLADNTAAAGASGSGGAGGKAGTGGLSGGSGAAGTQGTSYGGGLYVNGGSVKLDNSTIALNSQNGTGSGGGVVEASGAVAAASTLFAENGATDYSGSITATDCLFQTTPVAGSLSGSGNLVGVNPLLVSSGLGNNGGPTQTIALQSGSPAIGKGDNPDKLFADERGDPRPGASGIDIGAYQTTGLVDTQAPTATLQADSVTDANAASLNPYTFSITYSDNVAMAFSTLKNAVVDVLAPGSAAPISASVISATPVGATDLAGNAQSFIVTYEITPPGGAWTLADNGTYTVNLAGGAVTDLSGNPVTTGPLGTFTVDLGEDSSPPTAAISGPLDGYSGVSGQERTFTISATDPSPAQQADGFLYAVSWGDGDSNTYGPAAASPDTISHVYASPGSYTIKVTATDQAGLTSAQATITDTVLKYEVQGDTLAIGGATGNDSFVFSAATTAGSLTATLNGASLGAFKVTSAAVYGDGGTDTVTVNGEQSSANTFTLDGGTATFTAASLGANVYSIGLNSISSITFAGGAKGDSFTNTAATVASVLSPKAGGKNTFAFDGATMGAPATIKGAGTSNTLDGPDMASVWDITSAGAGNLNGGSWPFTDIQNLAGGSQTNDFVFSKGAKISGTLNGGGGGTLDESHYTTAIKVDLQTSIATGVTGKFSNIVAVIGGSAANTLVSANGSATWDIDGTNSGTVNGSVSFTAFANLTGGTASNDFVFASGAAVTGKITGNTTATNRLDYTAYTTGIYVNLVAKVATGTGGISDIQQVYGGSGNDILVGAGTGILLQAGSGNDLIIGGAERATIDGGSGQDLIIDGSTNYDSNATALAAIEAYWADTAIAFATRVSQLSGVGTPTGRYKLTATTVSHAGASDSVTLNSADDWLFWRKVGTHADTVTGTPEDSTFL